MPAPVARFSFSALVLFLQMDPSPIINPIVPTSQQLLLSNFLINRSVITATITSICSAQVPAFRMAMAAHFRALFLLFLTAFHCQVITAEPNSQLKLSSNILQESIINEINTNPEAGWVAAKNDKFNYYTVDQFKYILGSNPTPEDVKESIPIVTHPSIEKLPTKFDSRTAWPHCSSIGRILDQGHCGSCWAFGAVESLSDRFCISFGKNISLSVNDLLACCGYSCGSGCNGGYPISAWRYFTQNGVVTEECDPYFDDTGCTHPGCEPQYPTPKCQKKCKDENQLWAKSKHFSVSAYRVNPDPHDIMAEIYKNGPVEVSFTVYEDFAHYKSGVYKHVTGGALGGHAVKLIGWGTTNTGEDYWLAANQWNKGWGEDGYFRIRRGTNECGIEDDVVGGLPSHKNLSESVIRLPDDEKLAGDSSSV